MSGIKVAWVKPTKSASLKVQKAAALDWGADPDRGIWISDESTVYDLISAIQPGDLVAVHTADLLAPEPSKKLRQTRKDMFREIAELMLEKGVRVHELKTGRTCGNKADLVAMMLDARDVFAGTSGRRAGPGRPRKYDTKNKAFLREIGGIWYNRRYKSNGARLAMIQRQYPEFTETDWYRLQEKVDAALEQEEKD